MNNRIKELANQAGIKHRLNVPDEIWGYDSNLQKFAELIVRECAKIADLADENKCEWIGGNILVHFGVKQ